MAVPFSGAHQQQACVHPPAWPFQGFAPAGVVAIVPMFCYSYGPPIALDSSGGPGQDVAEATGPAAEGVHKRKGRRGGRGAHRFGSLTLSASSASSAEAKCPKVESERSATAGAPCPLPGRQALGASMLAADESLMKEVQQMLEHGSPAEVAAIFGWIAPALPKLSSTPCGCWVVQTMVEVAHTADQKQILVDSHSRNVNELYQCRYGNWVLQKLICTMSSGLLAPIVGAIQSIGVPAVAKHQSGCRVIQRLIESCWSSVRSDMTDLLRLSGPAFVSHKFGHFVLETLLEHGDAEHRSLIVHALLDADIVNRARHQCASHVIQKTFKFAEVDDRRKMLRELVPAAAELAERRLGSYVLETIRAHANDDEAAEAADLLIRAPGRLLATSIYFRRAAAAYGIELPPMEEVLEGQPTPPGTPSDAGEGSGGQLDVSSLHGVQMPIVMCPVWVPAELARSQTSSAAPSDPTSAAAAAAAASGASAVAAYCGRVAVLPTIEASSWAACPRATSDGGCFPHSCGACP
mmetsp:Transcript_53526/g.174221  ORF Transcript_53526/g.174221 Transcript_53526/m.174221 type:complete len:521 (-) Transcript_53526:160-1722(-)